MLVELWIEDGKIHDAKLSGTLYRGFEQILVGRSAMDMPYYTQRICGICSSAHAFVSALAVEDALGMKVPPNGELLRKLIFTSDILQNHITHFYILAAPDYFRGPDIYPFLPHQEIENRLSPEENIQFSEHYFKAFEMTRLAHAAFGVFGGKAPHGHGIVAGGVTADVTSSKINRYRGFLYDIIDFIDNIMLPDVELLFERYPELINLGHGNGNYLVSGGFSLPDGTELFPPGVILNEKKGEFNQTLITEEVATAWYKPYAPIYPEKAPTIPDLSQPEAYSWVKAPRYNGLPMELGPLARAMVAGEKVPGHGALSRLWARSREARKLAAAAFSWLDHLEPGVSGLDTRVERQSGTGMGFHEAMRGTLGHWVEIKNMRVKHYQIIPGSTWNFSSRDAQGQMSVAESALIGLEVDSSHNWEVGCILRSFDPCFSCTVHLIQDRDIHQFII